MAKKEQYTFSQLLVDISKKKFAPVYFFMGDEPYFIDKLTDALLENVLSPEEKDFNLTVLYGSDTNAATIITNSRRFPMMAERQLVVVKEAQQMDIRELEKVELYTSNISPSTVLVINYKHGKFDSRKKLIKDISEKGVVFTSKKLYDNNLPDFINHYLKEKGVKIEPKAAVMMADNIGADLNRLCSELDKLCLIVGPNKNITAQIVETNIGISKDYNNFELQKAIAMKDYYKANLIQQMFAKDPKNNPLVLTLSALFSFFSNLMLVYYAKDKSEIGISKELNLKSTYGVKDYMLAARNYNAFKTLEIISLIRNYDAKAKGYGGVNLPDNELLRELIYKIMH